MATIEILALIGIGIGIGFILTKGYQLNKQIKEDSKKSKEEKRNKE